MHNEGRNTQKTYLTSCRDRRLIGILTRLHGIATIQYDLTNRICRILAGIPAGSIGIARIDHPSDATLITSASLHALTPTHDDLTSDIPLPPKYPNL